MAKVRDKSRIPNILRVIARINQREARVGIFEDAPRLVQVAAANEFGVDQPVTPELHKLLRLLAREYGAPTDTLPKVGERFRIPERSFLRATADESEDTLREAATESITRMMRGELDAYETLVETAKPIQQAVIERVARGDGFEPNDPFTVALKGHARPLIGRTGVLETTQGIRLRVVRRA